MHKPIAQGFPQNVRDALGAKELEAKNFIGLAPQQVDNYCGKLQIFLEQNGFKQFNAKRAELKV